MKHILLSLILLICACEKSEPQKKIEGKYYNEADRYIRKPLDQTKELNKINEKRTQEVEKYLDPENN